MKKPSPFDSIRIVLVHPTHPGNIGAAARAMKTMGLSQLYLVNPPHFLEAHAVAMACGAVDVLRQATVCTSLAEALTGTILSAAMTARQRDLIPRLVNAREAAQTLTNHSGQGEVALVFGTEMSGLTIQEVNQCNVIASIPANSDYSSLNLAAAVQVMSYELKMAIDSQLPVSQAVYELARFEEIEGFYQHLEQTLIAIDFLNPQEPKRLMQRLRRLFNRTQIEKEEINILRGILKAVNLAKNRQFNVSPDKNQAASQLEKG